MTDDANEWLKRHGVTIDDDGLPNPLPGSRPHENCDRCGLPCEHLSEAIFGSKDEYRTVLICGDCDKLRYRDSKKFFREGWGDA